jgi:acetoin utilization deacetylase AcuC-like enzyme
MTKYQALYGILLRERLLRPEDVVEPHEAAWEELALVHTKDYLRKLRGGALSPIELRRLGLPWSEALLRRARLAVQGTIEAARLALRDGVAANLAGGTHHAFPDHGEGFCLLNDVAVAIRALQRGGLLRRALAVDLDVHQGNGTAAVFQGDPDVYTFSMHGEKNYPFRKAASSRDVDVPDGAEDAQYLKLLAEHLPQAFDEARPELCFYLAGVDVAAGDRFGRLALTQQGLGERDRMVLEAAHGRGVPIVLVLAGGYAATPELTAELHATAHREAARIFR